MLEKAVSRIEVNENSNDFLHAFFNFLLILQVVLLKNDICVCCQEECAFLAFVKECLKGVVSRFLND